MNNLPVHKSNINFAGCVLVSLTIAALFWLVMYFVIKTIVEML